MSIIFSIFHSLFALYYPFKKFAKKNILSLSNFKKFLKLLNKILRQVIGTSYFQNSIKEFCDSI